MSEPIIREAFKKVVSVAKRHNVVLQGMPVIGPSPSEAVKRLIDMGVQVVMYDADALMFTRACRQIVEEVRGL